MHPRLCFRRGCPGPCPHAVARSPLDTGARRAPRAGRRGHCRWPGVWRGWACGDRARRSDRGGARRTLDRVADRVAWRRHAGPATRTARTAQRDRRGHIAMSVTYVATVPAVMTARFVRRQVLSIRGDIDRANRTTTQRPAAGRNGASRLASRHWILEDRSSIGGSALAGRTGAHHHTCLWREASRAFGTFPDPHRGSRDNGKTTLS